MISHLFARCVVVPGGTYPKYATDGAAGRDLHARLDEPLILPSAARATIPVGVRLELPSGYEGQIRPRSGMMKAGVAGQFGTIDSDFRGELAAILINLSDKDFTVNNGDRIAQLVVQAVPTLILETVENLRPTERGDKGFGSSGK